MDRAGNVDLEMRFGVVTVDHVGIAVRSLEQARGFYEGLGMVLGEPETVAAEQVRLLMVPMERGRVELLEAMAEDSVIGRFVARRGEGMHHLALRVENVDAEFLRMQAAGVRLASGAVGVGAGGHRYFFVHPESTGGVLVEIVGA